MGPELLEMGPELLEMGPELGPKLLAVLLVVLWL